MGFDLPVTWTNLVIVAAAADSRLCLALMDGSVMCLAGAP
jgi:hypothetical protein